MANERIVVWVQRFNDRPNLVLQWHDPVTGKRRSVSAGTADEKAAELKRQAKEYELNNGLHREPGKVTWAEFRGAFEGEFVAARRPSTRDGYRVTLDHFEAIVGPKRVEQIDARAVSLFAAGLRKVGTRGGTRGQSATVKVRLQFLRTALRWAGKQGFLARVPEFPVVKLPRRAPQAVPDADVAKLLAACGDDRPLRAYLLCAYLAGCRQGEAAALRRSRSAESPWADFAGRRIWFPADFVKGDADQWVPMDPDLARELESLPPLPGDDRFFAFAPAIRHKESGGRIRSSGVSQRVVKLARRAGVRMTYKSLRRAFGCRYAARVPAQVLQKLMRHSDIKTTLAYYANVDDAVMAAVLGGPGGAGNGSAT